MHEGRGGFRRRVFACGLVEIIRETAQLCSGAQQCDSDHARAEDRRLSLCLPFLLYAGWEGQPSARQTRVHSPRVRAPTRLPQ